MQPAPAFLLTLAKRFSGLCLWNPLREAGPHCPEPGPALVWPFSPYTHSSQSVWDHTVTKRCGPACSLPWLRVSSCSLVPAQLVVQLPAIWISLVAHFSARLAGWPASPCGSTAASLAQWWWQECTARNRVGWDGTGKQDCRFWQPGRAGLAWASHGNLLLIVPLVNTNNSLLMGKLCGSIVFQNHSNHSIFLQIITELSVLSK